MLDIGVPDYDDCIALTWVGKGNDKIKTNPKLFETSEVYLDEQSILQYVNQ